MFLYIKFEAKVSEIFWVWVSPLLFLSHCEDDTRSFVDYQTTETISRYGLFLELNSKTNIQINKHSNCSWKLFLILKFFEFLEIEWRQLVDRILFEIPKSRILYAAMVCMKLFPFLWPKTHFHAFVGLLYGWKYSKEKLRRQGLLKDHGMCIR